MIVLLFNLIGNLKRYQKVMFKTQKQPKKSVGIIGLFEDSNSKKFTTTAEKISESMELQNYYKNDKKFEQAAVTNVFNFTGDSSTITIGDFNFPTVDHKGEKNMKAAAWSNTTTNSFTSTTNEKEIL